MTGFTKTTLKIKEKISTSQVYQYISLVKKSFGQRIVNYL